MPCIAGGSRTPTNKTGNYLADHTPTTPPMIPPLLMCCIKDVEERGIEEVGIYRVPGNESDANEILDKFMKVFIILNIACNARKVGVKFGLFSLRGFIILTININICRQIVPAVLHV